ncbi:MAG: helix-turn-helix domain-containing protein [Magnetococcales bacterium]|nr:helix-turn-helix domain-containing protein [Magnetococcales bacterium]
MHPAQYLATIGAAQHIGLGKSTLEKLRLTGGGPTFCKMGKAVRYKISDLDSWMDSRRVSNTSEADARQSR